METARTRFAVSFRAAASLITLLAVLYTNPLFAQGAGPNINFLTPVGLKTSVLSYMEADTNFRLGQASFDELNINTKSTSANFFYRFGWLDRLALAGFTLNHQDINGELVLAGPGEKTRVEGGSHGFGDPSLTLRIGLVGTPALSGEAWRDYKQGFQLSAQANWILPYGDYSSARVLNPGFNRHAIDLMFPMVLPIDGARRTTFLEFTPQVRLFGTNDDPFGKAARLEQDELYVGEIHLTHRIKGGWWLALGAQYQNGGATFADGLPRGEKLDQWYAEAALGRVIGRHLSVGISYGEIFDQANAARGKVLRLKLGVNL